MTNMLENMIAVAKKAGKIVLNYYDQDYEVTTKFNDPKVFLTTADTESEKYIIHELTRIFPDYQIVSEEKGNNAIDFSKNVFIVDPLDGTRQFVQHKKNFSVIIGLCSNGIPLAGVVYLPKLDETYFAEKGYGAYIEYKVKYLPYIRLSKILCKELAFLIENRIMKEFKVLNWMLCLRKKQF